MKNRLTEEEISNVRSRLTLAFKVLRKNGIAARQNFMCCMGCATAAAPKGQPFAYYHAQDAERLASGEPFCIGFCVPEGDDVDGRALCLGQKLNLVLEAVGLKTEWDGTADERIMVVGIAGGGR